MSHNTPTADTPTGDARTGDTGAGHTRTGHTRTRALGTRTGRALDGFSRLSRAQRLLTIVIATAPLLAWGCSLPTGAGFSAWTLVVVVALATATAIGPDSHGGLSTVLFLGWYWLTHVSTRTGDPVSPWTLGAGLCLLAFHTATAARATAPGPADLDRAFWRRWLRRVAIVAAATAGVWVLTAVMTASRHAGQAGLTLAAFAVLAGGTAYGRWLVVRGPTRT